MLPFYPTLLRYHLPELHPKLNFPISTKPPPSSKLLHKVLVEFRDSANPLGTRRQERSSEMQCVLFLAEARSGDDADSRGVEQAEGVELVWGAAFLLGCFNGFGGQVDGGEEVH